ESPHPCRTWFSSVFHFSEGSEFERQPRSRDLRHELFVEAPRDLRPSWAVHRTASGGRPRHWLRWLPAVDLLRARWMRSIHPQCWSSRREPKLLEFPATLLPPACDLQYPCSFRTT